MYAQSLQINAFSANAWLQYKRGSSYTPTMSPLTMVVSSIRYAPSHSTTTSSALTCIQAPLLLPLFSLIPSSVFDITTKLVYILLDLLIANTLTTIADSGLAYKSPLFTSPRLDIRWEGTSIAAALVDSSHALSSRANQPAATSSILSQLRLASGVLPSSSPTLQSCFRFLEAYTIGL